MHVIQNTIPVIKRALGNRFQYTDTELKKILQTLHRHRRDTLTISMDPLKLKANKQRTGTNTRRKDVSNIYFVYISLVTFATTLIFIYFTIEERKAPKRVSTYGKN